MKTIEIDQGNCTLGVFIDFSKAFDTINHQILLAKLEHYGFRGPTLNWVRSYLHKRVQFVEVNGLSSHKDIISHGVPQGSVLGPTLFLLYINDLPNSSNFFDFRLFADDSNLFHSYTGGEIKNIDLNDVNLHIKEVLSWCDINKLTINRDKTNYIIFRGKQKRLNMTGTISIRGEHIQEVDVVSFVGVLLDKHLTWAQHINKVNQTTRKKCGILFK